MTPSSTFTPATAPLRDFATEVALGNVTGYYAVHKFGRTLDSDSGIPTDVWAGADGTTSTDVWVPPTQARIHAIVSSSNADSDTGGANPQSTGMRTMRVFGLQTWDLAETTEDVVLDGTTAVNTANSYVIIHRLVGLTWGSGATNAGIVKATAATDNTITAVVQAGTSQTQMAILGVPSTQKLLITHAKAEIIRTSGGTVEGTIDILINEQASTDLDAFVVKDSFGFSEDAPLIEVHDPPKTYNGPAIAKLQVTTDTNNSIVAGRFHGYVVDN